VVLAHAAQTLEFTMQQQNHKMTTSLPEAPIWLQAGAARLEHLFVNLLSNAAKYTDAGVIERIWQDEPAAGGSGCDRDALEGTPTEAPALRGRKPSSHRKLGFCHPDAHLMIRWIVY
jgi:signal transduction histidine kinase